MAETGYSAVLPGNYFPSGFNEFWFTPAKLFQAVKLVIFRVFQDAVGMNARGVSKSVSTDSGLVYWNWHSKGVAGKLGYLCCLG